MEKFNSCVSEKNCRMKKILIPLILLFVARAINAQSEKKEPPPPPPSKVVDEKIKVKEPPPPPKPKEEVKYNVVKEEKVKKPPVIIDEKVNPGNPSEPPVITVKGKTADDFYKRNPSVSEVSKKGSVITVKKKDGTIEKYDMNKKEEDKSFTEKYGVSPIPPPPPPPSKKLS